MEISQITNTGTSLNPIISAVIDNIKFNNIPGGNKGTKGSTFWNHSSNVDVWKTDGDGSKWKPSVNAVDIDWNGAQPNPEDSAIINSTGDLFNWILANNEGLNADILRVQTNVDNVSDTLSGYLSKADAQSNYATKTELTSNITSVQNDIEILFQQKPNAVNLQWGDDENPIKINDDTISSTNDLLTKIANLENTVNEQATTISEQAATIASLQETVADLEILVRGLYAGLEQTNA